ncbi:MAG: DUF2141 domain-containing protein [Rhodospirillaceae bacterium]
MTFGLVIGLVGHADPVNANRSTIQVTIDGLRSNDGTVYVAIYDNPDAFPKWNVHRVATRTTAQNGQAVAEFRNLDPGNYAMAFFHDENSNGEFDQGLFGFPLEGYGFSNDAKPKLGPPPFEEAAFAVNDGGAVTLKAQMQY